MILCRRLMSFQIGMIEKSPICHYYIPESHQNTVTKALVFRGAAHKNSWEEIYIHRNCLNGYRFMVLVSDTFNNIKQKEKHFSRYLMLLKTNFTLGMAQRASYYDIREPKSLMLYDYWQRQQQQVETISARGHCLRYHKG